jgi:hypothetical protein
MKRCAALVWALFLACFAAAAASREAVVIVPVADVWSKPLPQGFKPSDDVRETQILFGERVLIHESSGPWARIEAVEQPEYTHHHRWEGYPGWVQQSALGSIRIEKRPTVSRSPDRIIQFATSAIGTPYLWGGLSPMGLDCSGLVHRSYREIQMTIPRDAHEQWMKARPIQRSDLKPADLVFSAPSDQPKKITHVALFVGWISPHPASGHPLPSGEGRRQPGVRQDGQIIEAPQTGRTVRRVSFREKYGKALDQVESGDRVGDRILTFGSFLP